jgi:hypothetical protein
VLCRFGVRHSETKWNEAAGANPTR